MREALVVNRVRSVRVRRPSDDSGLTRVTLERQTALIGAERGVLIGWWSVRVGRPVAQATDTVRDELTVATLVNTGKDPNVLKETDG